MAAFNILTLTCRLGRYSERPSLSFLLDCFRPTNEQGHDADCFTESPAVAARLGQTRTASPKACAHTLLDESFRRSAFVCFRPLPATRTQSSARIRAMVATSFFFTVS